MISAWLRQIISKVDTAETSLREWVIGAVRGLSVFQLYKAQKQLLVLKELAELLAGQPVHCCVVGGFAYDGLRGKLTANHSDIDLAVLETDADAVFSLLQRNGFRLEVTGPYTRRFWRNARYIDLFLWKYVDQSTIQYMLSDVMIRMPSAFLTTSQDVELMGVKYRIPSNEYLVSIVPLVRKADSIRFLESLVTSVPMEFRTSREIVQLPIEVTVHEFCGGPPCPSHDP